MTTLVQLVSMTEEGDISSKHLKTPINKTTALKADQILDELGIRPLQIELNVLSAQ